MQDSNDWQAINILALPTEVVAITKDGKQAILKTFRTSSGDSVFIAPAPPNGELRVFEVQDRVVDAEARNKMN